MALDGAEASAESLPTSETVLRGAVRTSAIVLLFEGSPSHVRESRV